MEQTGDYTEKESIQDKVRNEMKIKLIETIRNFETQEDTNYELTNNDIIHALSSLIIKINE